jgi:hypothetical protein
MEAGGTVVTATCGTWRLDTTALQRRIRPCTGTCAAQCCWGAALATRDELARIAAVLPELLPLLRRAAVRTIEREGFYCARPAQRPDFSAADEPHWMRIVQGRCIFYNTFAGGHCALHAYCAEHGLPPLALKPLTCYLFPVQRPIQRLITVRDWAELACLHVPDDPDAQSAYATCQEQLVALMGGVDYARLSAGLGAPEERLPR